MPARWVTTFDGKGKGKGEVNDALGLLQEFHVDITKIVKS
jgi:hypothetical protein